MAQINLEATNTVAEFIKRPGCNWMASHAHICCLCEGVNMHTDNSKTLSWMCHSDSIATSNSVESHQNVCIRRDVFLTLKSVELKRGLAYVSTARCFASTRSGCSSSSSIFFITGFLKPHPHLSHSPVFPEVALNPSQYLKNWRLSSRPAADGTTATVDRWAPGTNSAGIRADGVRSQPDSLGKQAQMLKMITALEELQRVVNSTLSSRITVMSRGDFII